MTVSKQRRRKTLKPIKLRQPFKVGSLLLATFKDETNDEIFRDPEAPNYILVVTQCTQKYVAIQEFSLGPFCVCPTLRFLKINWDRYGPFVLKFHTGTTNNVYRMLK